jgi:hypothetical protein
VFERVILVVLDAITGVLRLDEDAARDGDA